MAIHIEKKLNQLTRLVPEEGVIADVRTGVPDDCKASLLEFYKGEPIGNKLGLTELPAVKWRQLNLDRAGKGTRAEIVKQLTATLGL